ncbi:unnamed protein product [Rotaria socialis]|uniref:U-box domain-containing protein n=1 Tax=Rotaria socialis TaxID=392032 RepID=A0A818KRU0_9BILA|nr:unnamed protein product [Rotaria socialis]
MQERVTTRTEDYDLTCPITLRTFRDPVIAADGRTYEREAIARWIAEHGTSPFTRQPLNIKDLQPNYHMRNMTGRRGSSASSYYAVDESKVYQYPPTAPVYGEVPITKVSNNHRSGQCCSFRCQLGTILIVIILITSIICGLIIGFNLRKPVSTNKPKYSSSLTANSPTYCRTTCIRWQFYYDVLTVTVTKAGKYKFTSESNIDTYGYIYNSSFNPANPHLNLLAEDNDSGKKRQFQLKINLQPWETYVLVITTFIPNVRGSFSIDVSDPKFVNFHSTTTHRTPTKTTKRTTKKTTARTTKKTTARPSTTAPGSYYNYSSSLTSSSSKYCRRDKKCRESLDFYYEALQISVSMNGRYHFVSNGSMATYADIYNKTFDKLKPNQNLIPSIDDSSEENQFKLKVSLIAGNKYIMVVTTKRSNIMGKFSVTAIGSGSVTFSSLPQSGIEIRN